MRVTFVLLALLAITAAVGFSAGATETATEGPTKLVFLASVNVDTEGYDVNDNPYLRFIEEKNNVDIEIINEPTSSNYNTKVNTIMASGDLPDYLQISGKVNLARWANEGLIVPLDSYLKDTAYLQKDLEKVSWDLSSVDGKIYAVPMQRFDKSPYLMFLRKDFVNNLGIDTSKIKTLDDWYKMYTRFVQDDPDKNGKDDTFGIVSRDSGIPGPGVEMFLDAFGGAEAKMVGSEVLPFYMTDGYKNWLKYMAKLYAEKILDPEYVTTAKQQQWEKAKSGKYGSFYWFWSMQEYRSIGGSRDDLIAMRPPQKADGSGPAHYVYGGPVRHYIAVTSSSKYPDKVVAMMDWALSPEGGTFVHAGLDGLDYDLKDGMAVVRADRKGKNWAWRFITLGIQKVKLDDQLQGLLRQSWGDEGLAHLQMSNESGMYDMIRLLAPAFEELSKYDLDTQERVFRNKVIMGQVSVDAEWDAFVANWRKSGGEEWIKLHTDWYKTQK